MIELLNPIIRAGSYSVMESEVTVEGQARFIREFPSEGVFLVAARGTMILGMQDVVPVDGAGRVGSVSTFVALSCLRSGIGRALMERMRREAAAKNFETLEALIRSDNAGALHYYTVMGFMPVPRSKRRIYAEGEWVNQVLLEATLT